MSDIEAHKTVTAIGQFLYSNANPTMFTVPIDVEFKPDEIILKHVVYTNLDATDTQPMTVVKSDLVNNQILYIIGHGTTYSDYCNIHFTRFKQQIQGDINFSLTNVKGGNVANLATINTSLAFTFEFIKYKNSK